VLESPKPSYAQVTARAAALELVVAEQAAVIAEQAAVIVELRALVESLQVELAVWRRQAGRDATNSSLPPSQDGPASKAKAKPEAEVKARAKARAEQRSGVRRTQGGQKGHRGTGLARAVKAEEVESVEPLARGGCGGDLAGAPGSGPVCYGPNIAATTTLLASCDVIGVERAAELMSDLLGAGVSTGFVSSCLVGP